MVDGCGDAVSHECLDTTGHAGRKRTPLSSSVRTQTEGGATEIDDLFRMVTTVIASGAL